MISDQVKRIWLKTKANMENIYFDPQKPKKMIIIVKDYSVLKMQIAKPYLQPL